MTGEKEKTYAGHRSGFVAIVGAPNVGKSTLLNRLLDQKISITSQKPQTTRNRILGVLHRKGAQIVFLDTPGVHRSSKPLNVRIVEAAVSVLQDVDMALILVDLSRSDPASEELLVQKLRASRKPVILGLNKADRVDNDRVLAAIESWSTAYPFDAVIPISALNGYQLPDLVDAMEQRLPVGPPFFPEDAVTDVSERFLAGEIVREKVFRQTGQEIPYATAVTVESFEEASSGKFVRIRATIHVEKDTQKGIIIGKKGAKLKRIGEDARKELERMLGAKVYLELFVRVQKNWTRDTRALRRFGY
ncbi:MAG: GTPase Era [Desulfobacteraceae bacterium]|nr:GTPase Era [Desulfobacteraceae bacterium]